MFRRFSELISLVFQPLVMPTIIFAFLLFALPDAVLVDSGNKGLVFFVIVANTFIIPLGILMAMRFTKVIPSLRMENRKERVFPFSIISLLYTITAYSFYIKDWIDYKLIYAFFIITICLILLTAISFFWKISAHMIGAGGLLGIILAYSMNIQNHNLLYYTLAAMMLSGVIGTARLHLNAHTPLEVLAGFLLGFGVCFGSSLMIWV